MHENCMVLNSVCVASVGLNNNTEYYKLKSTGLDLDRSRLTDTRSAENDWIGADTEDRCIQGGRSIGGAGAPAHFKLAPFNMLTIS